MRRLTLDRIREVLPDLPELAPLWELALRRSEPDPERTWSSSGELGTVGTRLVDSRTLSGDLAALVEGEAARAAERFEGAVAILAALEEGDPEAAVERLLEAADREERAGAAEAAEAHALAALALARGLRDRRPAARALRCAARGARALARPEEAEARYREAYRISLDSRDPSAAADAALGTGNALEDRGAWHDAETWYRRALEALEGIEGIEGAAPQRWQATLNVHIALRSRGRVEESAGWLERAEREAESVADGAAELYLENARGQLCLAGGRFEEGEAHFRSALSRARGAAAVTVRVNLAESLLAQGRGLDAAGEAREAERHALRERVLPRLAEVYRMLGRVAAGDGNPDAFVFFERALELARRHRLPPLEEAVTLQAYADAEGAAGRGDAADELRSRAVARYRELGIDHERARWADVFGPVPPERERDREGRT